MISDVVPSKTTLRRYTAVDSIENSVPVGDAQPKSRCATVRLGIIVCGLFFGIAATGHMLYYLRTGHRISAGGAPPRTADQTLALASSNVRAPLSSPQQLPSRIPPATPIPPPPPLQFQPTTSLPRSPSLDPLRLTLRKVPFHLPPILMPPAPTVQQPMSVSPPPAPPSPPSQPQPVFPHPILPPPSQPHPSPPLAICPPPLQPHPTPPLPPQQEPPPPPPPQPQPQPQQPQPQLQQQPQPQPPPEPTPPTPEHPSPLPLPPLLSPLSPKVKLIIDTDVRAMPEHAWPSIGIRPTANCSRIDSHPRPNVAPDVN